MNKHRWFSERLNQWLDLEKLSKEELIAEVLSERKGALAFENELETEN